MIDLTKLRSFDLETYKIVPGDLAPKIVCGSAAWVEGGRARGHIFGNAESAIQWFRQAVEEGCTVAGANIAFDLTCLAAHDESLLSLIFGALRGGQIFDVQIAMALDAIAGGHLGLDPRTGGEIRTPGTNKVSKRYSLATCVDMVLGRTDAKALDAWRTSYALLDGVPVDRWPEEARQYPVADAVNTLEVAIAQVQGWSRGDVYQATGPARNLDDMAAQAEAAFCLQLGACWGLRADGERVRTLAAAVEAKHAAAVERFQKLGWVRADGSKDQAAVKRAIALAYGATGECPRCGGSGTVRQVKKVECRGAKARGRYPGCAGSTCSVCSGAGVLEQLGSETTCRGNYGGCDGTQIDLATAPMLPRTEKGGVKTDRDAAMESGNDDISDFSENEFEKTRSTFIPWLSRGIINPTPNVIVASGRCSYEEGPAHQMTRESGYWVGNGRLYVPSVRECLRARGAWCGHPFECVWGSTDYEAGELCCLAQYTYWAIGRSHMLDAINASGKPGILHSELAAEVLGISLEEMLTRLKLKDKQAVDFRQSSKPINFGAPALMGAVAIVLTSRKKSAGFTLCERGSSKNNKGERGYQGIRFCVLVGGAEACGTKKFISERRNKPPSVVCRNCVDVVDDVLLPAYFRRFSEIKDYFEWVREMVDDVGTVPCLVWDAEIGSPVVVRRRGGVTLTAGCNNGFQAMLADVGKRAFCQMTREGYLGVKDDGSPSPLAGARFPIFMHDEPVSELPEHNAHLAGPRIAEIMMDAGKALAPDVAWRAETALSRYLAKGMEPVYDSSGRLTVWSPRAAS